MKLSKIAKTWTIIVQGKATLTDTKRILFSYTRAVKERYSVHSIDVRIRDIVEDMMPSNGLTVNSGATRIRYILAGKVMMTHQGVLSLLGSREERVQRQ